ncbi:MAG: ABC transporter permease [Gemmatimonadota bacterium]|nr:MAG: ABC transporter permease [Gemmatimonadota bacterium]
MRHGAVGRSGGREWIDVQRLAETSGLPLAVCQRIIAVVDEARLSGEKRRDVIRELVAHFEDGVAAGRNADELVDAFGNCELAGQLIARAKRLSQLASGKGDKAWTKKDPVIYRLWRDISYAVRRLSQNPGFTATAILSLAIGIGANTAIFSLVNAVLLEKPPLREPQNLVDIYLQNPELGFGVFSYPDFEDLRDATSEVFEGVSLTQLSLVQVDRDGSIDMQPVELVTGNYFSLNGVDASLGRTFLPEDDVAPGAHPVVILGHSYWRSAFGGDADIVGRQIRLTGRLYTVVGVAPEEYRGKLRGIVPALYLPIMMVNEVQSSGYDELEQRGDHSMFVRARLAPGATLEQARVAVAAVERRLKQEYPGHWDVATEIVLIPTEDVIVYPPFDTFVRAAAVLLSIVVALVLLMACANLAGFLLAKATDRRKEIAVRLALGATRPMLVRQLLIETVLLGLVGGAAGVVLGKALLGLLLAADLPLPIPVDLDLRLDATVLGYSFAVSMAAGFLFGLAPALKATRPDVASTLKTETAGAGHGGRLSLRNGLVVVQIAVSCMLLVGAGLFLRTFLATQAVDPGFGRDPAAILTMAVPANRYSEEEGRLFVQTLFQHIEQIPGVEAVGLISNLHLNTLSSQGIRVNIDGIDPPPGREGFHLDRAEVDAGFFQAAGIRIVHGRNFDDADRADAPRVAIVNEAMARRFWPDGDAVGRMMRRSNGDELRVVGVASNAKIHSLGEVTQPFVYLPFSQDYTPFMTIVAKTSLDPGWTATQLVAAAKQLDQEAWLWDAKTMERHLGIVLLPARLSALLISVFAGLALTLATVGLYGIVSYAVSQRTHEMGIRMSLGADAGSVIRLLTGSGIRLVIVGGGIGLALALLLTRALSNLLFGVGAFDPATFLVVPTLLGAVALTAAYIPARRASRIDPVRALRAE